MSDVARAARHPVVRAALEEAGWVRGYTCDPVRWCEAMRADGFRVVLPAVEAIRQLGGLVVSPPQRYGAAYGSGRIVFDPVWAASGEAERINRRGDALGLGLTPVGEWMGEYVLLVAEDGSVLAETTYQFLRVGDDLCQALRRMIVADSTPEPIQRADW